MVGTCQFLSRNPFNKERRGRGGNEDLASKTMNLDKRKVCRSKSSMTLTPFESEILDSILWQVEGFRRGRVTRRVTTRILRATFRRIRPRLVARSKSVDSGRRELDHAIPLRIVCDRILSTDDLDRIKLQKIVADWLVAVELTSEEHRQVLQKCGLSRCMPLDWDGADPLARYRIAGIQLLEISGDEELLQSASSAADAEPRSRPL